MTHDVVISYSSKDKKAADAACAALEAAGIRCWIAPRDSIPGIEYGRSIIEAIDKSRAVILILSANANSSRHIPSELDRAFQKRILIFPLRIQDVMPTRQIAYYIGAVAWLDAFSRRPEDLKRFVENVKSHLEFPALPPPSPLPLPIDRRNWSRIAIPILGVAAAVAGILWFILSPTHGNFVRMSQSGEYVGADHIPPCTNSTTPDNARCTPAFSDKVAQCWDVNPYKDFNLCNKMEPLCIYKSVDYRGQRISASSRPAALYRCVVK